MKDELEARNIQSKLRTSASGRISGGKPFARGALYLMLQNQQTIRLALGAGCEIGRVGAGCTPAAQGKRPDRSGGRTRVYAGMRTFISVMPWIRFE